MLCKTKLSLYHQFSISITSSNQEDDAWRVQCGFVKRKNKRLINNYLMTALEESFIPSLTCYIPQQSSCSHQHCNHSIWNGVTMSITVSTDGLLDHHKETTNILVSGQLARQYHFNNNRPWLGETIGASFLSTESTVQSSPFKEKT